MSWISSIEFNNFKSYTKQKFDFPQPNNETNIVLIGGENGAGKTSFLEGLYLCLYGKDAVTRLARAGIQTGQDISSYSLFLNAALNKKVATDNTPSKMSVKVKWFYDLKTAFEVERIWFFNHKGIYLPDEDNIKFKCNNEPINPNELEEYLDAYFLPVNQAEFFFFDGEKVKSMLTTGLQSALMTGISALLGVDVLTSLINSLKEYKTKKTKELFPEGKGKVDEVDYSKKETELQKLSEKIENSKKIHENISQNLSEQKQKRQILMTELIKMGCSPSNVETAKDLAEQKALIETELKALDNELIRMLTGQLPFMLMGGHDLHEEMTTQLQAENKLLDWKRHKENEEPRKKLFLDYFLEAIGNVQPDLEAKQIVALNEKVISAWERLHGLDNTGVAEQIIHVQFGDSAVSRKQTVEAINQDIGLGLENLLNVLHEFDSKKTKLEHITKQLNNLQSTGNDERLNEIKVDKHKIDLEISELDNEKGRLEREMDTDNASYRNLESILERLQKQLRATDGGSLLDKADKIIAVLQALTQLNQSSLYGQKIKHIAQSATEAHQQLASKNNIHAIQIEPMLNGYGNNKVNMFVKNKAGSEIDILHLSAGEQQVLATALLAGLAAATLKKVPFVTDTPAGRLDESHREKLLEFWTNRQEGRQIIILSQNTEITTEVYERIRHKVSKTFLLRNQRNDFGFYDTTVLEHNYFGVSV